MKKAQVDKVFIYLITLIIAALVLFFGYKSIVSMKENAARVTVLNLRTAITNDVDVDSSFGTVKIHSYNVPADFREACFVEVGRYDADAGICDINSANYKPVICDSWADADVKQNLFLLPGGEPYYIGNITFPAPHTYLCLNLSFNTLKVRFRGLGDQTEITAVE